MSDNGEDTQEDILSIMRKAVSQYIVKCGYEADGKSNDEVVGAALISGMSLMASWNLSGHYSQKEVQAATSKLAGEFGYLEGHMRVDDGNHEFP